MGAIEKPKVKANVSVMLKRKIDGEWKTIDQVEEKKEKQDART